MKNRKSTKRALLMSTLALILSVSMLVGSTFAWFTDSVTSAGNKIQAGTLDLELSVMDENGTFVVQDDNAGPLFDYDKWEPGYTDVTILQVKNNGTLALKWVAKFVSAEKLTELANVIDVYVLNGATAYPADRDLTGYTKVGTVADFVNTLSETTYGNLEAGQSATLGIALKMQETAGNEYQGKTLGGTFDIQILATQYTSESDSFNNQYDADAIYADAYVTNAAELAAAIEEGGVVALMDDIDLSAATYAARAAANNLLIAKDNKVTIDMNGHKITGVSANDSGNQYAIQVKGDLTIVGEGIITMTHTGANMGWGALTAAITVEGGSLTLGEGVTVVHKGGSDMAYAVDVNSTLGATTLTVDGAVLSSSYIGVRLFNNHKTAQATVNLNSGVIDGGKRDIWVHNPSASAVDANGIVNIADTYDFDQTTQDASSYYGRIYDFNTAVSDDADGLIEALESGKDVTLIDDVKINPANMSNAYGKTGINVKNGQTIDGNGNVLDIKGAGGTWDSGINTTGGLIKNITVTGSFRGIFINHNSTHSEEVVLENVIIDGTTYTISCDQGTNQGLKARNSTFNGWTSYAATLGNAAFTDCSFGEGNGYAFCRPYAPTTFEGCDFEAGFKVDPIAKVTFKNCTIGGEPLTAENLATLVTNTANATINK